MYTKEQKQQFSQILTQIAEVLDISDSKYEEAKKRYEAIGDWLGKEDSSLNQYSPVIYPQGSFRLGTVVKPINDKDEYDIDLVCELKINKEQTTQENLKDIVGNRIKDNEKYKQIIKPGRRCWTLDYANEFHIDILPAIPDYQKRNSNILITDKELQLWQKSNPKGYAEWFSFRMKDVFKKRRILLAEELKTDVEKVPEYKVKTPLQRAVQIIKRHRDVYFSKKNYKPISIIITTLAGQAYNNEELLYDAVCRIVEKISDIGSLKKDGKYFIPNPVNLEENFADKWNENEELHKAFQNWTYQLNKDFDMIFQKKGIHNISESLYPMFGENIAKIAIKKLGEKYKEERTSSLLKMSAGTGTLGKIGEISVKDHTFYGN